MNTGLIDQLETYFSDLDEAQGTVSEDQVAERLGNVRELPVTPTPTRSRPKLWVAVAAAAVVLVLVGVLPLLLSTADETQPATEPPSTVTTVAESPTTTIESAPTTVLEEPTVTDAGGLTFQSLDTASFVTEWHETDFPNEEYGVWLLADGNLVAYHKGWDEIRRGGDSSGPLEFFLDGSDEPVADPVEHLLFSSDGVTWADMPTGRFDGLFTVAHVEVSGAAPFFYVSAQPWDANPDLASVGSTWATNDGETWFEVLVDGESASTYFTNYQQIGNTVLANELVSTDGGRSFSTVNPSEAKRAVRSHFVHDATFRYLEWSYDLRSEPLPDECTTEGIAARCPSTVWVDWWAGNPVLWESRDGENWTLVGVASGLDPRPDGRKLTAGGAPRIEALPDGTLFLVGTETRDAMFGEGGEGALYVLESPDGGLTWLQTDPAPTTGELDHDSLIAPPWFTGAFNGWVVISTEDTTLATNGDTWVRVEGPSNDTDDRTSNPLALRGILIDGFPTRWFANPDR